MKTTYPGPRARSRWLLLAALLGAALGLVLSCGSDADDTPPGGGGTTQDGGPDAQDDGSLFQDQFSEGGDDCPGGCPEHSICSHGICVNQVDCATDNDCDFDSYCVPDVGCVPWESPPDNKTHDPDCLYLAPPGNFAPTVQCELSTPPPGDPFPGHRDVQATPIVVNFNSPASAGPPSIVAPFTVITPPGWTGSEAIIRVLRGTDCTIEANLGGVDLDSNGRIDWIKSSTAVAAGDLDLDGVAEIVAYGCEWTNNPGTGACEVETTLAFTRKNGQWSLLWKARLSPTGPVFNASLGAAWAGLSIHDLDDDGLPEVIREAWVISHDGIVLAQLPPLYSTFLWGGSIPFGLNPVLANLDQDPAVELTNGQLVWQWSGGAWQQETYYPGANGSDVGFVAVADFGAYGAGLPPTSPELAVVHGTGTVGVGYLTIRAMDGTAVLGPLATPGGGGGNPTVADYDGDGLPEVGVAGRDFYSVFDIDCTALPRPNGTCTAGDRCDDAAGTPGACPAGVLWSRKTQDHSSQLTGSSVFDFEADGEAEAVYADECFARVYRGTDGEVLFSQFHSSCTWYENPVVADVDGDFRAEMVVPSNLACSDGVAGISCSGSVDANGVDRQFAGLRCQANGDCVSGVCTAGFCRCLSTGQCCAALQDSVCLEHGFQCAPPPASIGGDSTCRAAHPHGLAGIRVYSDAQDKWVRSRTIWNQHAYAVTHVNEDGTIPATSAWASNWTQPELNNFRQNVPGTPDGQLTGDLTAGASQSFICSGSTVTLSIPICNRGSDGIGAGVVVGFYDGDTLICSGQTQGPLQPGECEDVTCVWADPPTDPSLQKDIRVVANDGEALTECKEGNNEGIIFGVYCEPVR